MIKFQIISNDKIFMVTPSGGCNGSYQIVVWTVSARLIANLDATVASREFSCNMAAKLRPWALQFLPDGASCFEVQPLDKKKVSVNSLRLPVVMGGNFTWGWRGLETQQFSAMGTHGAYSIFFCGVYIVAHASAKLQTGTCIATTLQKAKWKILCDQQVSGSELKSVLNVGPLILVSA